MDSEFELTELIREIRFNNNLIKSIYKGQDSDLKNTDNFK